MPMWTLWSNSFILKNKNSKNNYHKKAKSFKELSKKEVKLQDRIEKK